MGILKSGLLGPFRKKTGPAIGRRHKGQNVITALHHKSNKPLTPLQLEAQEKFGLLSSFLNKIGQLVNPGFKQYAKRKSPVNTAFSYNYDHAFVKTGDNYLINYPKIVYSRGHIVVPSNARAVPATGQITFSWQRQNQSAYCQHTDLASLLVYNPVKHTYVQLPDITDRYTGEYTMLLPLDFSGDTVHCYMSFASADGKLAGNSVYVVEVVCQ